MNKDKLPPLPELVRKLRHDAVAARDRASRARDADRDLHAASCATYAETCDKHADEVEEALRQSQSMPAGAVAGLVGKWRTETKGPKQESQQDIGYDACLLDCADELEQALQADARKKGEAVDDEAAGAATLLRAMVSNYKHGHCWDHLDAKACTAAADQIDRLLATQPAQASEKKDE